MTSLENGPVLVTGADRFIGSHVVEALLARGTAVRALVMYNSFTSWGVKVTVVRPFNTDGPRQSARAVIPAILSDNSKAARLRPEHAGIDGLRRGLRQTIDWFRVPETLATDKTAVYNR